MENSTEITLLRQMIEGFIAERLQSKLEKTKDEEKSRQLSEAYQPHVWIADAARRARQIQLVTHALKYTHPDARGTSLRSEGNPAAGETMIGTHSLQGRGKPDVVGNAAALDVFKFLSLTIAGRSLWQRAADRDPALLTALPGSDEEKREWVEAFAAIVEPKGGPASHKLAKQIYWPLGEGRYHLLQPLFASTLVHRVWEILKQDRFSEAAKIARQARREDRPHPHGYRDWPRLTVQKFGSTKPQNISQLNSERRGEVWLLPSMPPTWQRHEAVTPLKVKSVFERFGRIRRVREHIQELGRFLTRVRDWNNVSIRNGRARRVEAIIDELLQYAAIIRQQPPGWSADPACHLPEAQRLWLDTGRADPEFTARHAPEDWSRAVAEAFGAWLNERLRRFRLPVGDVEYRAWRREFEAQLQGSLEEMES